MTWLALLRSRAFLVRMLIDRSEQLAVSRSAHLASLRECARLRDELARPLCGECDWGYCDADAVARRYYAKTGLWLPVCVAHMQGHDGELRGLDSADLEWLHEIEDR